MPRVSKEKNKEYSKKYRESERGKLIRKQWNESDEHKASVQKYKSSQKGKESLKWKYHLKSARDRGINNELSRDFYISMCYQDCWYCGNKPPEQLNGVDRIDSNFGYSIQNSRPCCWNCNRMKGILTEDDFLAACRQIIQKHSSTYSSNRLNTL